MHIQLFAGLAAALLSPGSFQDLDALDARVSEALGAGTAVPIDRRIKLAACPQEPLMSAPAAGAVSLRCPALGWKIRVAVVGARAADVQAETVVHKGDAIELVAQGAGFSASYLGTALDEGGQGSVIRVKIPTSPSPLSATIARAGVATISD